MAAATVPFAVQILTRCVGAHTLSKRWHAVRNFSTLAEATEYLAQERPEGRIVDRRTGKPAQ